MKFTELNTIGKIYLNGKCVYIGEFTYKYDFDKRYRANSCKFALRRDVSFIKKHLNPDKEYEIEIVLINKEYIKTGIFGRCKSKIDEIPNQKHFTFECKMNILL